MSDQQDMFGYGSGYVPQMDKIMKQFEMHIPDIILDKMMSVVMEDAREQGVDLDSDDDDKQDMLHETIGDVMHTWVDRVRKAAKSSDPDDLHFMLLPF